MFGYPKLAKRLLGVISYPARLIPLEDGTVLVRLPDVPEVSATGRTEEEALVGVRPVLEAVLRAYLADGRPLPRPSDTCGAPHVEAIGFSPCDLEDVPDTGRN